MSIVWRLRQGTLDELSEVMALANIGQWDKPCVIYNKSGFYDLLLLMFDQMVKKGFLPEESLKRLTVISEVSELDRLNATGKHMTDRVPCV